MQDGNKEQQQQPPRHFLLLDNPKKSTHLGTLLRCAAAFRAHQVLIVGHDKFNAQGSFGSHLYLDIVAFPSWESVVDYLKCGADENTDDASGETHQTATGSSKERRIPIVGISGAYGGDECVFSSDGVAMYEDADTGFATLSPRNANSKEKTQEELPHKSYPIHTRPFSSDACFLLSKDKRGLPISHARMCDSFVHVSQICFDADDSHADSQQLDTQERIPRIMQSTLLETATIYSIVLHHFTAWANYNERSFAENQKFIKDTKSDMRRRLCRRYGENLAKKEKDGGDDSQTEDGLILGQSGGVFASDY